MGVEQTEEQADGHQLPASFNAPPLWWWA